jgi:chromosome partitioning protein
MKMIVISIANRKGGVGKTFVASHIAYELASSGYKVLLVDMDNQCDLTRSFIKESKHFKDNIYTLLEQKSKLENAIKNIQKNLDIIPGSKKMEFFDNEDENILNKILNNKILNKTDFVIIDNPPAINNITLNSFVASNFILGVTEAEKPSVKGLKRLVSNTDMVKTKYNQKLKIIGIILNKIHYRRKLSNIYQEKINKTYKHKVFNGFISNLADVPKSIEKRMTVKQAFPTSKIAEQVRAITNELIEKVKGEQENGHEGIEKRSFRYRG